MLIPLRLLPSLVLSAAAAAAAPIVPASYAYLSSSPDSMYADSGGVELTDGHYNGVTPGANLAYPNANSWVGIRNQDTALRFTFAETVTIDSVTLSMAHWTHAGVYLPTSVVIGSTSFGIDASDYPNLDKALLVFTGSWTGSQLDLSVARGGEWTFFDEIRFTTGPGQAPANPVPEAASTAACLSLAILAGCFSRGRLLPQRNG